MKEELNRFKRIERTLRRYNPQVSKKIVRGLHFLYDRMITSDSADEFIRIIYRGEHVYEAKYTLLSTGKELFEQKIYEPGNWEKYLQ